MSAQKATPPEIQITVFTPELHATGIVRATSYDRISEKVTVSNLDELDELKKYEVHSPNVDNVKNAEEYFTFSGIRVTGSSQCFNGDDEEALLKCAPNLAVSLRSLSDGTTSISISGTYRNAETSDTDFTSMYHPNVKSIKDEVNYLLGLLAKTGIISDELAIETGFTPDYKAVQMEEETVGLDFLPT